MRLTWEATERNWKRAAAQQDVAAKAEQRTEQRALQQAVRRPAQLRNSNELYNELLTGAGYYHSSLTQTRLLRWGERRERVRGESRTRQR